MPDGKRKDAARNMLEIVIKVLLLSIFVCLLQFFGEKIKPDDPAMLDVTANRDNEKGKLRNYSLE